MSTTALSDAAIIALTTTAITGRHAREAAHWCAFSPTPTTKSSTSWKA